MRISVANNNFNGELDGLISAARADLRLSGVLAGKTVSEEDTLITRAIFTYCKANFGWDNPDAVKLMESYEKLKQHLTLSQEYTVEPEEDDE